ncbi:hypothetical protein ACTFIW_001329 [Dictyostelium discoideum]
MESVKKTGLTKKKDNKKYSTNWDDVTDGEQLRAQLITATKAYKAAGDDLQQIIGPDSIIHNTFIGMKNIQNLESGNDKDKPANLKTAELCKKLKDLTKLTGTLIKKHKVDFLLIQNTKSTVLNS